MFRVLLVGRYHEEDGGEERPHRLVPKLAWCWTATKFGAAPHAGARIAAASGQLQEFSRLQPYAVFQRCGAPEFAMWGRPIFYAWTRMAAPEAG